MSRLFTFSARAARELIYLIFAGPVQVWSDCPLGSGHMRMSRAVALVMGVNVVDLQRTIASTSFNEAAETADIPCSQ